MSQMLTEKSTTTDDIQLLQALQLKYKNSMWWDSARTIDIVKELLRFSTDVVRLQALEWLIVHTEARPESVVVALCFTEAKSREYLSDPTRKVSDRPLSSLILTRSDALATNPQWLWREEDRLGTHEQCLKWSGRIVEWWCYGVLTMCCVLIAMLLSPHPIAPIVHMTTSWPLLILLPLLLCGTFLHDVLRNPRLTPPLSLCRWFHMCCNRYRLHTSLRSSSHSSSPSSSPSLSSSLPA